MPDIQPIHELVGRSPTTFGTTSAQGEIDKNGFLTLLIEQMKNQDPMDPMDSSQYASDLAQFTSLEEMQNQSDLLNQGLQSDYILSQAINNTLAGSLVGTDVKAFGEQVGIVEGEAGSVSFELPAMAGEVEVRILNESGNEVRTMTLGRTLAGEHTVPWDGEDNAGQQLADGLYTVEVSTVDSDGNRSPVTPYIIGQVDAVRFTGNGSVLVVDGVQVNFGDVIELRNHEGEGQDDGPTIASLIGLGGGA